MAQVTVKESQNREDKVIDKKADLAKDVADKIISVMNKKSYFSWLNRELDMSI
jgi:hypothetical protein